MAGRNRCGHVFTSGPNKDKKCNLGMGHDGNHKYTPPKERPPLDLASIGANVRIASPKTMVENRRVRETSAAKTAERKFVDQIVESAYAAWIESGSPKAWGKSQGLILDVPNPQVDGFKSQVHQSAKAHEFQARFGSDIPNGDLTTLTVRITDIPEDAEPDPEEEAALAEAEAEEDDSNGDENE